MPGMLTVLKNIITRRITFRFDKVDFTFQNVSWRRLRTWFLSELAWSLRSSRVWSYPALLQVEPGNVCNLRCPVCHSVTDGKPQGFLSRSDFSRILDEVADDILFLHFWGWGEPFMNPDFLPMVKLAKKRGLQIISSTNGHFFEKEDDVDTLIDSGLDVLIVALDGTDRATYEKYRKDGDYDKVINGLRQLVRRKRERAARAPRINLRMLVTRENEGQVDAMRNLAAELGVELFSLKTVCSFDNEADGTALVPCRPEYRRFSYGEDGKAVRQENTCKKFWNHPTIYRDGTVVLCDYHTGQELSFGNAFEKGFGPIWFGPEMQKIRKRFLQRDRSGLRCENCPLNYAGVDRCVSHIFPVRKAADSPEAAVS